MAAQRIPQGRTVGPSAAATDYNFEHFRPGLLVEDARLTMRPRGPEPGDAAPDFELEDTTGRTWRLSELRGTPVVLVFGSAS